MLCRAALARRAAGVLALAAGLAACTPSFDWRTVNNEEGRFSVMYPAKPALDERTLKIGDQSLRMQMQSARVGDVVFAVGVVMLPDASPATQASVLAYLQQGLARNIGAAPRSEPARIALDAGDSIAATQFAASGTVADAKHEARYMRARFAAHGARVYEAVIVAPAQPAAEQADQFFDSLKLD
jgi:hypothetical protein